MTNSPTWNDDVRYFFTQYDVIQMRFYADLSDYDDVKTHAENLYLSLLPSEDPTRAQAGWSRLPNVHVMPKYTGPWPQEQIAAFRKWIDSGFPLGTPVPRSTPDPRLEDFVEMSRVLTGFDDLDDSTAGAYLARLTDVKWGLAAEFNELLDSFTKLPKPVTTAQLAALVVTNGVLTNIAQAILQLWYVAGLQDANGFVIEGSIGTPRENQYTQGLVWRAAQAHPMGYADELVPFYWQNQPENGKYTGLLRNRGDQ